MPPYVNSPLCEAFVRKIVYSGRISGKERKAERGRRGGCNFCVGIATIWRSGLGTQWKTTYGNLCNLRKRKLCDAQLSIVSVRQGNNTGEE
jgi:hypothetical protein